MKTIKELVLKNKDKLNRMNCKKIPNAPKKKVLIFEKNLPHEDDLIDFKICPLSEKKHKSRHALMVGGVVTAGYPNLDRYACEISVSWKKVFRWCIENGIRVVVMSVVTWYSEEREEALREFSDWGGIVLASSGNWEDHSPTYPAKSPYTIAVSATNTEDTNFEEVDITTESFWFAKRYKRDSFSSFGGTSGTAPVMGFVALRYLLYNPTARLDDFRRWVFRNSYLEIPGDPIGKLEDDERFFIFPDSLVDEYTMDRGVELKLQIDNKNMVLNGEEIELRVAPFLKPYSDLYSAACTELRPIFEAIGCNVVWNDNNKSFTIEFK